MACFIVGRAGDQLARIERIEMRMPISGAAMVTAKQGASALSEQTAANATHHLICRHVCRWTKNYAMKCHVLKTMPDGRLKLLVFGDRNWKDREHLSRIRYVEADRVRVIAESDGA